LCSKQIFFFVFIFFKIIFKKNTSIVECLKDIKKKEEESLKEIAGDIIFKWKSNLKSEVENNRSKSDNNNKAKNENERISKQKAQIDSNLKVNGADSQSKKRNSTSNGPDSGQDLKKAKLSLNDYKQKSTDNLKSKANPSSDSNKNSYDAQMNKSKSLNEKNVTVSCIVPKPDVPLKSILPIKYSNTSNSKQQYNVYSSANSLMSYNKNENLNNSQNEDDGLAQILSSKHSKRILYTGKKTHASQFKMKSLFELSVQALINSLDELPYKISVYSKFNSSLFIGKLFLNLLVIYFSKLRFNQRLSYCFRSYQASD